MEEALCITMEHLLVVARDPRRLWEFVERIGAVTRPPPTGNEREREREWLGSVTVSTLDLRSRGRGFNSRSGRYQVVSTSSDCLRTGKQIVLG